MKIAIGSDHAGFKYKEKIKEYLLKLGHDVKDFGTNSDAPVDYPVYIRPTAEAVARGECERGIVLGGSGNGEAIVANRVKGVRCALCWNVESAKLGHDVKDFGTNSDAPVDYPVYIRPTAEAVARGECERGIVLGGSGNGEAIVANRVKGVRCALCWNLESARLGRQHNNANVISIGERMVTIEMALEIVKTWLDTPFEGGRHQKRIDLIDA